jgi:cell division protein FtsI/penicillin-binding protein 2
MIHATSPHLVRGEEEQQAWDHQEAKKDSQVAHRHAWEQRKESMRALLWDKV